MPRPASRDSIFRAVPSRLARLCAALSVGAFLLAPSASLAEPEPTVRSAVERADGRAVAGATVQLLPVETDHDLFRRVLDVQARQRENGVGLAADPLAETRSADDGSWQLSVPVGVYRLRVTPSRDSSRAGRDEELDPPGLDVLVHPVDDTFPAAAELPELTKVRVRVVAGGPKGPQTAPVAGALVRLRDASPRRGVWSAWRPQTQWRRTGDDGTVEFLAPAGQTFEVAATAPGRAPVQEDVHADAGASAVLAHPASTARRVRVEDASGAPAADVVLAALGLPLALTDDDGSATVHVPSGGLRLQALAADGSAGSIRLEPPPSADGDENEAEAPPAVLRLLSPRTVTGRVIDTARREPVAGALVRPQMGYPTSFAVTDGAGSYRLELPAATPTRLVAQARGHFEHTVALAADSAVAPTLALRPAAELWGTVATTSGEPVADARVTAFPTPEGGAMRFADTTPETRTDAAGGYRLRGLEPGRSHQIEASAEGFAPGRAEGRTASAGEAAAAAPGGEAVDVVLSRGVQAYGRVVDEADRPVAGATVELAAQDSGNPMERMMKLLRGEGPDAEAVTDAEGVFTLRHVASGRYALSARAPGYAPTSVPGVELLAGDAESDLGTLVLVPGVAVDGVVLDTDDQPLAGAQIRVTRRQGGGLVRVFTSPTGPVDAVSGADGSFRIADLADGQELWISAQLDGYEDGSISGIRAPNEEPARLVLERAAEVRGRVVDDGGAPVAGAEVGLEMERSMGAFSRSMRVQSVFTDADGRFEFLDVPPRQIQVTASADGFQPARRTVEPGEGQVIDDVELELRGGARVTGTVTDAAGRPVVEAQVVLESEESSGGAMGGMFPSPGTSLTDGDGRFVLDGLPTGRQTLVARKDASRASRVIDVRPGSQRTDLRFAGGARVTGRVTDAEGLAAAEVGLTLRSTEDYSLAFTTASRADGTFQFDDVAAGSYRLTGEGAGHGTTSLPEPVTVAAEPVAGLELRMLRGQAVVGRLLGADFDALSEAQVLASTEGSFRMGEVDYEGGYRVEGLVPGRWRVQAALGDGRRAMETVEIEEGLPETVVDLDFEDGESLAGEVVSPDGPAQGVMVSARGIDVATGDFARTDSTGRFEFRGLEAGRYRLTAVDDPAGLTAELETDVPGPEVRLELESVGLEGRVLDAWDGSPVSGAEIRAEPAEGDTREGFERLLRSRTTSADDDGRFSLRGLHRGAWTVDVTKSGYGAQSRPVEVFGDGTSVEISLEPSEGLWLTVRRTDGAAVPRVALAVLDDAGRRVAGGSYVPDDQGRVVVSTAPPGRVRVVAQAPGTAPTELDVLVPEERAPVVLTPGAYLDLEVPALVDDPVRAEAVVTGAAARSGSGRLRTVAANGMVVENFPLRRGESTLGPVEPGTWTVTVTTADGRSWSGTVQVAGPGRVEVRLE